MSSAGQSPAESNDFWPEGPGVTGDILPLRRDPQGQLHLAAPGFVHSAVNALVGPGEVLTGKTPFGDPANPNPYQIAQDITGTGFGLATGRPAVPGSLSVFGGIRAKTADLDALAEAKKLWANGEKPGIIIIKTGWFNDVDGNWKFEIPDAGASIKPSAPRNEYDKSSLSIPLFGKKTGIGAGGVLSTYEPYKLGEILDHPDLYEAYPEAANIPVRSTGFNFNIAGAYDPEKHGMLVGSGVPKNVIPVVLHEMQHAIQTYEGFARGGNPQEFTRPGFTEEYKTAKETSTEINKRIDSLGINPFSLRGAVMDREAGSKISPYRQKALDSLNEKLPNNGKLINDIIQSELTMQPLAREYNDAFEKYKSLSGEVESRNVEARWATGMNSQDVPPWMTQGYPTGQQITIPSERKNWLQPVNHNPFAHVFEPVEHDPFAETKP